MRVALAGTFAGLGGIQVHLSLLAELLASEEHDILLLSFGRLHRNESEDGLRKLVREKKVRLEFVDGGSLSTLLGVQRSLRMFEPEIYFACGTGWNLFAGAIISRVPQLVFHEVMSGESSGWRDSRNLVRRFFHHVVAQAHPVAKNFARTFRWKKPIQVIPAFSQPLDDAPPPQKRSIPLGTARGAIFGRLVPHKRVAWLVSEWPRLKQFLGELHVHGAGPEEPVIRDLIARNKWQNTIFCHGAYPQGKEYAQLMASYDLTLLPTIGAEGAPLVLLESMACGVPFVATDAGGIRDYDNPDCLITSATEPEEFLAAVEKITTRLARGEVDQPRLQQFYRSHFGHEALARKWLDMFNSLR